MSLFRQDPGPCPICGAAHTTCTATSGPPTVTVLSQRDAAGRVSEPDADSSPPLGDGSDERPFSTKSYRGQKKRR